MYYIGLLMMVAVSAVFFHVHGLQEEHDFVVTNGCKLTGKSRNDLAEFECKDGNKYYLTYKNTPYTKWMDKK